MPHSLTTNRLILRQWRESDLEHFAKLNADPEVMKFFPSTLSKEESDNLAKNVMQEIEKNGWGFWAAEIPGIAPFIGFIGIHPVPYTTPFTPAVEIGWRLSKEFWGHGYATEGAKAALNFGFNTLLLNEIVSFTFIGNKPSIKVMERLGMTHDAKDDFDHPKLPPDHKLCRHVLYRISNPTNN